MPAVTADALTYLGRFVFIAVAVVGIAVLTTACARVGHRLLAVAARAAHRRGLFDPARATRTAPKRDRSVLLLSRALRTVSKRLPGNPRTNPQTIIVPVVGLGVPVFVTLLLVLWAIPLALFGYLWGQGSGLLAFLGLCGYFGAFLGVWHVGKRTPVLIRRSERRS